MNNEKAWSHYVAYTRDITEFSRKLAFAGIAICWVIKPEQGGFSNASLAALALFALFFVLDIAQYSSGAVRWYSWIKSQEKKNFEEKGSLEGDYSPPEDLDRPAFIAFWAKVVALSLAFVAIGIETVNRFA